MGHQRTAPATVEVHRLYNPWLDGAHMFTVAEEEVRVLDELGWVDEGVAFIELAEGAEGSIPVFRLYNPNNGDHFFTTGEGEATALERDGWCREGIAWYAPQTSETPAYRLHNPYQTEYEGLGNHLWTTSEFEADTIERLGWLGEGVGWYAVAAVPET